MPELPEVESVRRQLDPELSGRRVLAVWADTQRRFHAPGLLLGRTVEGVGRRGKFLLLPLMTLALAGCAVEATLSLIDGTWTSVGSANFDDRSFRLNDEANLNVFSKDLAAEQIEYIEADIAKSKRMVRRRWARRSTTRRIYENLALLVRSQL